MLMLLSCFKRYGERGMNRISGRMKLWCMDFKEMVGKPIPKFGSRGCYEEGIIQPSLQEVVSKTSIIRGIGKMDGIVHGTFRYMIVNGLPCDGF
ncbi:hypothetical protein HanPSC8_Chr17g0794931 [Helianthus annuus]|nr:hypothetical protein HanIR_Chr17g0899371 [Helianthus annuus]KAJ0815211.1 hypothetical protein HanPSC8_Chr17g0794931 [Helianthus annuus]